jgi:internalin A
MCPVRGVQFSSDWQEEIKKALTNAKVAILLVTPDFIASDFITKHELTPLLDAAKQDGLTILWMAVRHGVYNHTEIPRYHPLNDPSKPVLAT